MTSTGRPGHGLIRYGISMYQPLCASTCRDVLSTSKLDCSEMDMSGMDMDMDMGMGSETSPECHATDNAFLATLAYCISTRCQDVPLWNLERYWTMNVAGTSVDQPLPKATYQETLANMTTRPKDTLAVGGDLNRTMLVPDEDYRTSYRTHGVFERVETNHATYGQVSPWPDRKAMIADFALLFSIVLIVSGAALPIALSLLRFVPLPASLITKFTAWFIGPPLLGARHKTPIMGLFHIPTRGQAFFIFYLIAINIILSAVGYPSTQPNSWYPSAWGPEGELTTYFSNRTGVLSFANIALLFLYAGRNNVLLWVTNWSHGTFLLLHRWVAWIATIQAILHSLIYLEIYAHNGTHATESKLSYWIWGVVATLCMSILLPTSILPIRSKVYEVFLAWHVVLSILTLVGCLWHILQRFQYQWGYENWIYTAIAVWGFDGAMRLARLARNGIKTAKITIIDEDYVHVSIDNVSGSGHAYLYFPTLTWRIWENHPFSVASAVLPASTRPRMLKDADMEKSSNSSASSEHDGSERLHQSTPTIGLTFLLRTKMGITRQLSRHATLPVLVESGYGPHEDLSEYSSLICIAGGVGITACIPYLRAHPGAVKLFWGVRSSGIVDTMAPSLGEVEREVYVGRRMDIGEVLDKELGSEKGSIVVLVSGPSEMADEVRCVFNGIAKRREGLRIKLVEEAFSW
ncbi:MAG: hypothetical protein Q9222_000705 [Ikaeria aurantiellina]